MNRVCHSEARCCPQQPHKPQLPAAVLHLRQSLVQIDFAAAVGIGGQKCGSGQRVMFGPVHVDAWLFHELQHDRDGVLQRRAAADISDELREFANDIVLCPARRKT